MATADQVCYLYNQYKDAIKAIPPHIVLSEDDIADFIKFRNDIGRQRFAEARFCVPEVFTFGMQTAVG